MTASAISLRALLSRLIWLCVLPLVLLAAVLAADNVLTAQAERDQDAEDLARNFATAIDQNLKARINALSLLAESRQIDDPSRWNDLYQEAQGFHHHFDGNVILADIDMHMLFNTRVPFGSDLPMLPTPLGHAAAHSAKETGGPAVGDIFLGPIIGKPLVAIAVPILRQGRTALILLATFETQQFQERLDQEILPDGWSLSVLDGEGGVIARRAPPGQDPAQEMVDAAGRHVVHSTFSPWSVVLEIPRHTRRAPLLAGSAALIIAILGATLVAVLGGLLASRRLGRAVASLAEPSADGAVWPEIREIAAVRQLLDKSIERHKAAETGKRESEQRFHRLFRDTPNPLAIVATNGTLAEINKRFVQLFGYTYMDLPSLAEWWLLAFPEPAYRAWVIETWTAAVSHATATGTDIEPIEYRVTCKNGMVRTVMISGIVTGGDILATFFDLTENKQAETALRNAQAIAMREQRQAQLAALNMMEDALVARAQVEKAHASLRESETMYRSLFDNMLNGFAYCRILLEDGKPRDFVYLAVNGAFTRLTGLKDVVGRTVSEVIPGFRDVDPVLLETYGRVAVGGTSERFEIFVNALGMWFAISVYCPGPGHFVVVFDVITDRKLAEEALVKSRAQLNTFIQQAPISIAMLDRDMTYLATSGHWLEEYGRGYPELVGRNHYQVHPDVSAEWRLVHQQGLAGATVKNDEDRWVLADGTELWLRWAVLPWTDENGAIGGIIISAEDISERKRGEAERALLGEALRQAAQPLLLADAERRITYINPAFTDLFGYGLDELKDKPVSHLMTPTEESEAEYDEISRQVRRFGVWNGEAMRLARDGTLIPVAVTIAKIHDGMKRLEGFVVSYLDLRRLRDKEARLAHAARLAIFGEFAAGLTHELAHPVAVIRLAAESALDHSLEMEPPDQFLHEKLELLDDQATRMAAMIEHVRTFSRIGNAPDAPFAPQAVIRSIERMVRRQLEIEDIVLTSKVCESTRLLNGNAHRLEEVLLNLISNAVAAIKARRQAGGGAFQGKISLACQCRDGEVRIKVGDNGNGIAKANADKVFESFFTTKGVGEGLGLGLAISATIVKSFGGDITFTSKPGATVFRLDLPSAPP